MTYKEELISLLSKPENISTALEISDTIWQVKTKLQGQFWDHTRKILSASIGADQSLSRKWSIFSSVVDTNPTKQNTGLGCRLSASEKALIKVVLEVENKQLFVGVGFTEEHQPPYPDEVHHLQEILKTEGHQAYPPWWLGVKWIRDDYMTANSFLEEVASAVTVSAEKAAESALALLRDYTREVEAAEVSIANYKAGRVPAG